MINLDQARELLARAVATQGRDFIYNPGGHGICLYNRDLRSPEGSPKSITGCLIGVALRLAGEKRHHGHLGGVRGIVRDFPDMMTFDAMEYFIVAQRHQDAGRTWGVSYEEAEGMAKVMTIGACCG